MSAEDRPDRSRGNTSPQRGHRAGGSDARGGFGGRSERGGSPRGAGSGGRGSRSGDGEGAHGRGGRQDRSGGARRGGPAGDRSFNPRRGRPQRPGERTQSEFRRGQTQRVDEPRLPENLDTSVLPKEVHQEVRSLSRANSIKVLEHILMATDLAETDPERAVSHARAAKNRAGRISIVRETNGILAYRVGEWAEALSELRAARRMSGGPGQMAIMADCERGLGRPRKAIELADSEEAQQLSKEEQAELRIVVAGAYQDLGEQDTALQLLLSGRFPAGTEGTHAARYNYALADAYLTAGQTDAAVTWFLNASAADVDDETDAEVRVAELVDTADPASPA